MGADLCGRCHHPYASHGAAFPGGGCSMCSCIAYTLPASPTPPAVRSARGIMHARATDEGGAIRVESVVYVGHQLVHVRLELDDAGEGVAQATLTSAEAAEIGYWLLTAARDAAIQNADR